MAPHLTSPTHRLAYRPTHRPAPTVCTPGPQAPTPETQGWKQPGKLSRHLVPKAGGQARHRRDARKRFSQ